MVHLGTKGDPYGQNFNPMGLGSNHVGGPLWSILDIKGTHMDKISTLGGGEQSRWGYPMGHFGRKGGPLWTKFRPWGGGGGGGGGGGAIKLGTP